MFEELTNDTVERYMASLASEPPYIPKTKTPEKTVNDILELALKKLYDFPGGYVENLRPWVDNMVSKNAKKRLKKIFEKYEDTCEDLGIVSIDQFKGLYYIVAIVVEQIE